MESQAPSDEVQGPVPLKGHLAYAFWLTLLAAVPILLSGFTLRWPAAWAFLGLLLAEHLAQALLLWAFNPTLIRHRLRRKKGVAPWDRRWMAFHGINSMLLLILPGLQRNFGHLETLTLWVWIPAAVVHLLGAALTSWAMASNPHFEGGVRIQTDRDQRVVDAGPYGLVRHPGYTGFLLLVLPIPFLLGSTWALGPAFLVAILLVWRARREDLYLRNSLPGYIGYSDRIRRKLVPWVW